MLGLEISINGAQGEMVKDRLVKAEKAWVIGRKFFLNTKIEKKIRIQLLNASIRPILQYGMSSQQISNISIKKLQQKFSKIIRKVEEKEKWIEIAKQKKEKMAITQ